MRYRAVFELGGLRATLADGEVTGRDPETRDRIADAYAEAVAEGLVPGWHPDPLRLAAEAVSAKTGALIIEVTEPPREPQQVAGLPPVY